MANLSIDNDLISETKFFSTNGSVKLVIAGIRIPRQKVKSGILQKLTVFPILFLIYISRVFFVVEK